MLRAISILAVFLLTSSDVLGQKDGTAVNCGFQSGETPSVKPTKCGYQRGWDGMLRANWKITQESRDGKIVDSDGYFALFEARKRPTGYSSRLVSPFVSFYDDMCITFSYVNKGPKTPYPTGRSSLQVFFAPNGRSLRKDDKPIWKSDSRTVRDKWEKAKVAVSKLSLGEQIRGSIVFAAVRGGSKRSYIAIDDVALVKCDGDPSVDVLVTREGTTNNTSLTETDIANASPYEFLRSLAAHRPTKTRKFSLPPGSVLNPANPVVLPKVSRPKRKRGRSRSRGNRRRNNRRRKRPKEVGVVYFTEEPDQEPSQPFVPTLIGQERPQVVCDFMDYTQGLRRCLRAFFSMLKKHKSRSRCNSDYYILESCLQSAATKCVPSDQMTSTQVEELVSNTLRNKFKTQRVYCFEEGAFVYPEFSLGSIPLQCTREYFGKLTVCGGSFAGVFNFKHGDPSLCSEYFTANECQRRTTAEECNFDTRSMLIYGLNLQYQFAHNPFCIDLPFSAWWPTE